MRWRRMRAGTSLGDAVLIPTLAQAQAQAQAQVRHHAEVHAGVLAGVQVHTEDGNWDRELALVGIDADASASASADASASASASAEANAGVGVGAGAGAETGTGGGIRRGLARPGRFLQGLLALLSCLAMPVPAATAFSLQHQGVEYDVYRLDPGEEQGLRFYWKRPDGSPYASLQALRQELAARGERLTFAVNGGIYSRDLAPLGLYVEDGATLVPLNRGRGGGNFFLKPNGVFYVTTQGAGVAQTDDYRPTAPVRYAVQSGPMLVIDGALHPRFIPGYESRYVRNGVGVDRAGRVLFAISDGETNFHDFGTLFRDRLDCPNALYLDGQISQMYLPPLNHYAFWAWRPLVAIIALTQPAEPASVP